MSSPSPAAAHAASKSEQPTWLAAVPAAVFVLAALPFLAQALGADPAAIVQLRLLLPVGVLAPDRILALLSAAALAALALGLHRRKQIAWRLATAALGAGLLAQLVAGARPIALVAGAATLAVLAFERRRYVARSPDGWPRTLAWTLGIAALAVAVETLFAIPHLGHDVRYDIRAVVLAVASWASFADRWLPLHHRTTITLLPSIFARLTAGIGVIGSLRSAGAPRLEEALRIRARSIVERFGRGALRPFQLGERVRTYAVADRDGAVVFGETGRSLVVLGDPIGPGDDGWAVFRSLVAESLRRDQTVMVYQASGESRHALLETGFSCFRVGQEAIVDLGAFSLAGSRRANLRHTVTRAKRGGIAVRWLGDGLADGAEPELRAALTRVDAWWTANHPGRMGFTIGTFEPDRLVGLALAVASDAQGEVAAFATFRPTGPDGGWVLDLMRRAPGGVPGAMEACIAEAAERLRDAGGSYLSLGLAPLAGLSPADGPLEERLLARAASLAGPAYDVRGLAFFKNKFDPLWLPRYGAVRHRRDLPAFALALLELHLGGPLGLLGTALALARPARPGDRPLPDGRAA